MTKIVHVGLPKCASTSLQALYTRASGTTFIGKGGEENPVTLFIDRITSRLTGRPPMIRGSSYVSRPVRDIFRDALPSDRVLTESEILQMRRTIDEAVGKRGGDLSSVLASDEVLSGMGFVYFNKPRRRLEGIIEEVGRLFGPDAMVMVVMRSQISFLSSYWKHLVRTGYPFTWSHFLSEQADSYDAEASDRSVTSSLFYDTVRRRAAEIGVRVAFVPFEDVVGPQTILRETLAREGIRIPKGLPHRRRSSTDESHIVKLERNRTQLLRRGLMFRPEELAADEAAFRTVLATRKLQDDTPHRERLTEAFRPENRAFAEATGFDLKSLKYPV